MAVSYRTASASHAVIKDMEQRFLQSEEVTPSTETLNDFVPRQSLTDKTVESIGEASTVVEQGEDVHAVLSQEAKQFQRHTWRAIIAFELFFLMAAFMLQRYAATALASPAFIVGFVAVLFLLAIFSLPSARRQHQRRRRLTATVAEQYDVRSIGALIDALKLDDLKTREIAQDALISVLPRLQASDATLLHDAQRAKLCHILSLPVENPLFKDVRYLFQPARNSAIDIRIAILQAFEQVGDNKALSVVERLAKREAGSAGEKRIQEAARQCLPALQLRTEEQRSSQTLLRAVDASTAGTDILLQAATGTQDVQPEQLLRPSS